jgi:predicted CXXCH cytochrome family protein
MKSVTRRWRFWELIGTSLLLLVAQPVAAQITGTKHDLSGKGWGSTEICLFCHTPHNATTGLAAPLWNHATTVATYQLYDSSVSSTLNAVPSQPSGVSKLCLSCHDGTVALDSFGTRTGTNFIAGTPNLGTDLRNDHPVSFTYDAALAAADGGLVAPASAGLVVTGIPLFSSKVECASCHNVHSNTNSPFLRTSNVSSALCLKCHNK